MVDYFDPEKLVDTAAASLRKDLGQQAELEGELVELQKKLDSLPESVPVWLTWRRVSMMPSAP